MKMKLKYFLDVRGSALVLKTTEANKAVRDGGLFVIQEWTDDNTVTRIVSTAKPKAALPE
jgi:hypothetical protein